MQTHPEPRRSHRHSHGNKKSNLKSNQNQRENENLTKRADPFQILNNIKIYIKSHGKKNIKSKPA